MTFQDPIFTLDGDISQCARLQQSFHVCYHLGAAFFIFLLDVPQILLEAVANSNKNIVSVMYCIKDRISSYVVLSLPGIVISQMMVRVSSLM